MKRHPPKRQNTFAVSHFNKEHLLFEFSWTSCRWGAAQQSLRKLVGLRADFHRQNDRFLCVSKKSILLVDSPEKYLELKNFGIWGIPSYVVAFFLGNLCRCRFCVGSHRSLPLPLRWNSVSPCGCRRKDGEDAANTVGCRNEISGGLRCEI